MPIVNQKDKRSGITYAYESISWWDKEKKQSRSKRTLVGRVDESGNIIPTDGRMKKNKTALTNVPVQSYIARKFYGATYLLQSIGDALGVTEDLRSCFPDTYKQILSIAYYLILEDSNPLSRFEKWGATHKHPYDGNIPSQRSSELFMTISEDAKNKFFGLQGKRRTEKEYWAYDITSISSYSQTLRQVQFGVNKDDDRLPQINLALVFGEESNLPFYYRKLAGNIPDVKTVKGLLADMNLIGTDRIKWVMDRGFYSQDNINDMYKEHMKFIVAAKTSLSFVKAAIDEVYDEICSYEYLSEAYQLYSTTKASKWQYRQKRPYKGDTLEGERRIYIPNFPYSVTMPH